MKKVVFLFVVFFVAGMAAFLSCERDDISVADENILLQEAENEAVSEVVLQYIEDMIENQINLLESNNYDLSRLKSANTDPCNPTVTVETPPKAKFPKTITLDWGTGCTLDGNFRAGKVIVHLTGPYWEKNTVRTAKLQDYIFNDLKIAGDRHVTNKGTNENGYYVFDIKHSVKITKKEGGELVCERDWTRERIQNRGELKVADDEIWITGSAKVEKNGIKTVKEITTTLYRKLPCAHFQSGVITTIVDKKETAKLDYGFPDGNCDDKAQWTNLKNGKQRDIILKPGINHFSVKK